MISIEDFRHLVTENRLLKVQLEELNEMLYKRDKEISTLREIESINNELHSRLDSQLEEFHSMQNSIGEKEQEVEGVTEREQELQEELDRAIGLVQQYNDLANQYNGLLSQYNELEDQYNMLLQKNKELQQLSRRIGEMESQLDNTILERDEWKAMVSKMERAGLGRQFSAEV
jgi:chromosome segregation ATPase